MSTRVTESLIQRLREREAKGIETYGTTLKTFNGRSAPKDLSEELLDAAQYSHQWEIEREALERVARAAVGVVYGDLPAARTELHEALVALKATGWKEQP